MDILSEIKKQVEKDYNYVQLYLHENIKNLVLELSGSAIKLFLYLSYLALEGIPKKTEEAFCIVSFETIIKGTNLNRKTIIKAIDELEQNEYIKVFKTGKSNVYAINPNKMWKSKIDNKGKALYYSDKFSGVVVRGNIVIDTKEKVLKYFDKTL